MCNGTKGHYCISPLNCKLFDQQGPHLDVRAVCIVLRSWMWRWIRNWVLLVVVALWNTCDLGYPLVTQTLGGDTFEIICAEVCVVCGRQMWKQCS